MPLLAGFTAIAQRIAVRLDQPDGWHNEDGFEIAQALALAAAAIFATIAIFAIFKTREIELVNNLFNQIAGGN